MDAPCGFEDQQDPFVSTRHKRSYVHSTVMQSWLSGENMSFSLRPYAEQRTSADIRHQVCTTLINTCDNHARTGEASSLISLGFGNDSLTKKIPEHKAHLPVCLEHTHTNHNEFQAGDTFPE